MSLNRMSEKPAGVIGKKRLSDLLMEGGLKGDYSDSSLPANYDRREEIVNKRMKERRTKLGLNLLRRIPQIILAGGLIFGGGKMVADSGVIQNGLSSIGARVSEVLPKPDTEKGQEKAVTNSGEEWQASGEETKPSETIKEAWEADKGGEAVEESETQAVSGAKAAEVQTGGEYWVTENGKYAIVSRQKLDLGEVIFEKRERETYWKEQPLPGLASADPMQIDFARSKVGIERLTVIAGNKPMVVFKVTMPPETYESYASTLRLKFTFGPENQTGIVDGLLVPWGKEGKLAGELWGDGASDGWENDVFTYYVAAIPDGGDGSFGHDGKHLNVIAFRAGNDADCQLESLIFQRDGVPGYVAGPEPTGDAVRETSIIEFKITETKK